MCIYVYVHVGVAFPFIHRLQISRLSNNVVSCDTLLSFCLSAVLYGGGGGTPSSRLARCVGSGTCWFAYRQGYLSLVGPEMLFEILDAGQLVALPWFTHLSTQMPGTKDYYANRSGSTCKHEHRQCLELARTHACVASGYLGLYWLVSRSVNLLKEVDHVSASLHEIHLDP